MAKGKRRKIKKATSQAAFTPLAPVQTIQGKWSRADFLTALGIGVAVVAVVSAITVPEIRRSLGLDSESKEKPLKGPSRGASAAESKVIANQLESGPPPVPMFNSGPAPTTPKKQTIRRNKLQLVEIPEGLTPTAEAAPSLQLEPPPGIRRSKYTEAPVTTLIGACQAAMTFGSAVGDCLALRRSPEIVKQCGRLLYDADKLKCIEISPTDVTARACTSVLASGSNVHDCLMLAPTEEVANACHKPYVLDSAILDCIRVAVRINQ